MSFDATRDWALMTTWQNARLVSSRNPQPKPPAPDDLFGRYRLVRRVGAGGMGVVYEAVHQLLRKRVALKIMHAEDCVSERTLARFLREAESAARIRHSNIVDVVDVGMETGVPFMVMELLEGEDLSQHLRACGALGSDAAVDTVLSIAMGVSELHAMGVIHRDIKPANIFLARDGAGRITPKLLDFGITKHAEDEDVGTSLVGTPHYMAPEQLRGARADERTDQYAVAVALYECLAGHAPFEGESLNELLLAIDAGVCVPAHQLDGEIPAALSAIIQRAMARDPERRYRSVDELARALVPFASPAVRERYESERSVVRHSSIPPARWTDEELALACSNLLVDPATAPRDPACAPESQTFEEQTDDTTAERASHEWGRSLVLLTVAAAMAIAVSLSVGAVDVVPSSVSAAVIEVPRRRGL